MWNARSWVPRFRRDAFQGRGQRAVRLSIIFGVFESIVWAALGWAKGGNILDYVADHFGDITIGLATTAYVIFTYHLLENAEAQRRLVAEPHLTVKWYTSNEPAAQQIPGIDEWLAQACKTVSFAALNPAALPLQPGRYVNLELHNNRDEKVTWLELDVIADTSSSIQPAHMDGKLSRHDLELGKDERLEITVADLGPILAGTPVTIRITSLNYGPADQGVRVATYGGESTMNTSGNLRLDLPTAPLPEKAS